MPCTVDGAGAVPILLTSNPPTWLLLITPPLLTQLTPMIPDVFAVDVVEVLIIIDPLFALEPIIFPSDDELPPMFIPEPFVSIPVKTFKLADVGTEETVIAATVFTLISEAGVALVVVNNIPW